MKLKSNCLLSIPFLVSSFPCISSSIFLMAKSSKEWAERLWPQRTPYYFVMPSDLGGGGEFYVNSKSGSHLCLSKVLCQKCLVFSPIGNWYPPNSTKIKSPNQRWIYRNMSLIYSNKIVDLKNFVFPTINTLTII